MKYLKIFIFIMIMFLNINVFASNTNVSNKIKYSTSSAKGTYEGDEIYLGGYNGQFSVGTRYNGRLGMLSFYLSTSDYDFSTNHTYTITLNMATDDWRNKFMGPQVVNAQSNGSLGSTLSVSNFRFVSMKQIKFNFKTGGTLTPYLFFRLYSTDYGNPNGGTTAITGVNNWNLSSIYINNNVSSTPTPAPVTPAPTPTPQPNNQDIINNQNQNTQDIINNQNQNNQNLIDSNNQNTTDIIENNNQNTQDIINNQNQNNETLNGNLSNCYTLTNKINIIPSVDYWENGDLSNANGGIKIPGDSYIRTKYFIKVENNVNYYFNYTGSFYYSFYKYDSNFNYLGRYDNTSFTSPRGFSFGSTTSYIKIALRNNPASDSITTSVISTNKFQLEKSSSYTGYSAPSSNLNCVSKLDSTNNAINDVNNSINNDNIDSGVGSDFFNDFQDNSHGLTSIITAPLTAIASITSSTCQPLSIPIPFTNGSVSLPCMTQIYEDNIPTIYNIWKIVSFGIIAYFICVDIFHIVKGFKDPESDKVEVLDL